MKLISETNVRSFTAESIKRGGYSWSDNIFIFQFIVIKSVWYQSFYLVYEDKDFAYSEMLCYKYNDQIVYLL